MKQKNGNLNIVDEGIRYRIRWLIINEFFIFFFFQLYIWVYLCYPLYRRIMLLSGREVNMFVECLSSYFV